MVRKFHDPVQLKLKAIRVQQPKILLITYDQLPEKNPKVMVIHSGTSDLTYKVNTLQKIRKVINTIKENDVNNETEIFLSSVIHRDDQDLEDEINKLNKKLENLCKGKGMRFIDNSNLKGSSLNRSKLHLNKSGTALLTKNFAKIVNSD